MSQLRTSENYIRIDYSGAGSAIRVSIKPRIMLHAMAQLFQCSSDNISLHLKNIYEEGELQESATTEDFSAVRREGKRAVRRIMTFYNLDAVISVGYRVKSYCCHVTGFCRRPGETA